MDAATVPTAAPVLTLRAPTGADLTTDSGVEAALAALRAELSGQRIPLDAVPMVQVVAVRGPHHPRGPLHELPGAGCPFDWRSLQHHPGSLRGSCRHIPGGPVSSTLL
ncbi:MAG: hypothetical protein U1U88_001201 [Lawsonella clevelandensis]